MNIKTKYNVGYQFWDPRARINYNTLDVEVDGLIYKHDEEVFNYEPRHKVITAISIYVKDNNTAITYMVKNIERDDDTSVMVTFDGEYDGGFSMSVPYSEEQITDYTEEEARLIGKSYADRQVEYFG